MSGATQQNGTVVQGHVAAWQSNGALRDAGPADGGNISEVGITNNGNLALGINSGPTTAAYTQYGVTVSSTGVVTIGINSFVGGPAASLQYNINGVTYAFNPAGNGNIAGPTGGAPSGDLVAFNGTTGYLVHDSGILAANVVQGPASVTLSGNIAVFDGTTGKLLKDGGVPASGFVTGPGSSTAGHLASFNSTTGQVIADSGIAVSGSTIAANITGSAATAASATTAGSATTATTAATLSAVLGVALGGTGVNSLTGASVVVGNGTSPVTGIAPGTAGNVLTSTGSGWSSAAPPTPTTSVQKVVLQPFSATSTYVPTAGMLYCTAYAYGGCGGGGANNSSGGGGSGGGGGGGELAISTFNAATIGASQAVTIGAAGAAAIGTSGANGGDGGMTSLGSILTAAGGGGGGGGAPGGGTGSGGGGGTGSVGQILRTGQSGYASQGGVGAGAIGWGGNGGTTGAASAGSAGFLYIIEFCA